MSPYPGLKEPQMNRVVFRSHQEIFEFAVAHLSSQRHSALLPDGGEAYRGPIGGFTVPRDYTTAMEGAPVRHRLLTGDAVAATIAHEVKQPLSAMVTNADAVLRWLDRATPDLDEAKAAIKQVVADGRRAAAVIERVRATLKGGGLNKTAFDFNGLVGDTLALVRSDLQKHRILVRIELNEQLPEVIGDRVQLQQVLLNLITNAVDSMAATDEPRVLCVKSDVHADEVKIVVTDTGTGIGSRDIDRIFDPLYTTKSDGMGMGLAICRSIIEAHSGRIWMAPNKPRGAVFQFVLFADSATSASPSRGEQPDDLPFRSLFDADEMFYDCSEQSPYMRFGVHCRT
jgi:signal transduction histidine kinase